MSNDIVPQDNYGDEPHQHAEQDADQTGHASKAGEKSRKRRRKYPLPPREQALYAQSQLPGLVALKVLTPAQANAMSRATQVYLSETREASQGAAAQLSEDMLGLIRANPELQNLLEPIISDEQIDTLMKDVMDGDQS